MNWFWLIVGISLIILGIIFIFCACVIAKKADEKITENTNRSEKKLLKIINHYGIDEQITVLIEEMSELTKELCKYKRNGFFSDNAKLEVTDVQVCLDEIKLIMNYLKEEQEKNYNFKVDRQIERIEKENIKKVEQCKK